MKSELKFKRKIIRTAVRFLDSVPNHDDKSLVYDEYRMFAIRNFIYYDIVKPVLYVLNYYRCFVLFFITIITYLVYLKVFAKSAN